MFLSQRALADFECIGVKRAATKEEIQRVFDLAAFRPSRMRVVADLTLFETPWNDAQVAAELASQTKVMKEYDGSKLSAKERTELFLARSNAIVRAHTGEKVHHVVEWYTAGNYRQDATDDSVAPADFWKKNPNTYLDSFINAYNTNTSEYQSASVIHEIKSVMIDRTATPRRSKAELWRALSFDEDVSLPLLFALRERPPRGQRQAGALRQPYKLDALKADRLSQGTDPRWKTEVCDFEMNGTRGIRFELSGKWLDLDDINATTDIRSVKQADIQVVCWLAAINGRFACIRSLFTNLTAQTAFLATRERFNQDGVPGLWTAVRFAGNGVTKIKNVSIREMDLNGSFVDAEVFLTSFPSNYSVSDNTFGNSVVVQHAPPGSLSKPPLQFSSKRKYILIAFAVLFLGTLFGLHRLSRINRSSR